MEVFAVFYGCHYFPIGIDLPGCKIYSGKFLAKKWMENLGEIELSPIGIIGSLKGEIRLVRRELPNTADVRVWKFTLKGLWRQGGMDGYWSVGNLEEEREAICGRY